MAHVSGPTRSLPGSHHKLPAGIACDDCGAPATHRIQGETDSFGAEYIDLCETCYRKEQQLGATTESACDWCGKLASDTQPYRDMEEGMCGPVYQVCGDCRKKDAESWAREI